MNPSFLEYQYESKLCGSFSYRFILCFFLLFYQHCIIHFHTRLRYMWILTSKYQGRYIILHVYMYITLNIHIFVVSLSITQDIHACMFTYHGDCPGYEHPFTVHNYCSCISDSMIMSIRGKDWGGSHNLISRHFGNIISVQSVQQDRST